jgi:2-keto-4-pentenoate hydratase
MASATKRTVKALEQVGENAPDALFEQLASLRKEVAAISDAVSNYSGHALGDMQRNAVALARDVRQQGAVVGREVNRQAHAAGKVVQENPVPALVVLGTIALLSTLLFRRD